MLTKSHANQVAPAAGGSASTSIIPENILKDLRKINESASRNNKSRAESSMGSGNGRGVGGSRHVRGSSRESYSLSPSSSREHERIALATPIALNLGMEDSNSNENRVVELDLRKISPSGDEETGIGSGRGENQPLRAVRGHHEVEALEI